MTSPKVANASDCLTSLARSCGFESWRDLYEHPSNEELRKNRPNPNQLSLGDLVAIPEAICEMFERGVDAWHEFVASPEIPMIRMRLLDDCGKPMQSQDYLLKMGGQELPGTTDGDGVLEHPVLAGVTQATLTTKVKVGDSEQEQSFRLLFGRLDPISTFTGIQARLSNLGFYSGLIDGDFDVETSQALAAFQAWAELPQTGFFDSDTLDELEKRHDEL